MRNPFKAFHYSLEVVTPVHIGAAKESDYLLGADFYYDASTKEIVLFRQTEVLKSLTALEQTKYSNAIAGYQLDLAATIIAGVCKTNHEFVYQRIAFPFEILPDIRRHYATGMGKITIPGSSLKGALRSIFGHFMIEQGEKKPAAGRDFDSLFGTINQNLMRFLQVTDVELDMPATVTPMKVFSGDVFDNIHSEGGVMHYSDAEGRWKHELNGGHGIEFEENGFVFLYETIKPGSKGQLRLNWAAGLDDIIHPGKKPVGYRYFSQINGNNWMNIARDHMKKYLEQERLFYQKFRNDDFVVAESLLDRLADINMEPNTVLLRLGAGSGYHAITGNWRYNDHTQTGQARIRNRHSGNLETINAIKYKTRKVAFGLTEDDEGELLDFQFPGFIKLSIL